MPATKSRPMPDRYFQLVRRFPLMRITSDDELDAALGFVDELLASESDSGAETYLNTLSALIHLYESEHHPMTDATPAEVLRDLAVANGLTGAALAERTNIVPSTISSLLSGKRRPTPEQMTALAAVFNVEPSVFLPSVAKSPSPSAASARRR